MADRDARRRRIVWAAVIGAPLAFLGLLFAQAMIAVRGEYEPDGPGFVVDATVEPSAPPAGEALRLAVLGDSLVAGLGSPTLESTLPHLVAERVAAELGRPVRLMGYGVSGARTADLLGGQLPDVVPFEPDVVVVVIGSNDVTHLTLPWDLRKELTALLEAVEADLGAPVILAGIPLFGEATALARPLRDVVGAYAGVLRPVQRAVAADRGIAYVEIARDASPRFVGVDDAMSRDGFHPAPTGYGFWADAIAPAVVGAVE